MVHILHVVAGDNLFRKFELYMAYCYSFFCVLTPKVIDTVTVIFYETTMRHGTLNFQISVYSWVALRYFTGFPKFEVFCRSSRRFISMVRALLSLAYHEHFTGKWYTPSGLLQWGHVGGFLLFMHCMVSQRYPIQSLLIMICSLLVIAGRWMRVRTECCMFRNLPLELFQWVCHWVVVVLRK